LATAKNKPGRPPGSTNKKLANTPAKKIKAQENSIAKTDNMYCSYCGKFKKETEFYMSTACIYRHFGKMPICINCLVKMYDELLMVLVSEKKSVYQICMELNIPFVENAYQASVDSTTHTIRGYITKMNSLPQYKGLTFKDSEPFGDNLSKSDIVVDEEYSSEKVTDVSQDMVDVWGNIPKQDILWMENEYIDWCRRYKVDTKSMELIVRQICHLSLSVRKKNEQGMSTKNELDSIQKLMSDAALKPVQENSANGNGNITPMMWIQKFENDKPISDEKLEEFKDIDGIWKLIRIFFVGHLCKMMGMENEFSEEYENEMLQYTVDADEVYDEGDEENGLE